MQFVEHFCEYGVVELHNLLSSKQNMRLVYKTARWCK